MANITKGSLFPPELVEQMINKVRGKSSLAVLSQQIPVAFNGSDVFIFSMDDDVAIVGEGAAKPAGDGGIDPVSVVPVKVVYQMRTSDEFMIASEEKQLAVLKQFAEGWHKKLARGLDIMAFHRTNPATGVTSSLIKEAASFDTSVDQVVQTGAANEQVEAAIEMVQENEYAVTGMIMSPKFRSALSKIVKTDGNPMFPELAWGNAPSEINGLTTQVNPTVSTKGNSVAAHDAAIVGDFENGFKWGYAKEMPIDIIEYGDPDGQGDLKQYNQILLRGEAYIGFAVMDPDAFAIIQVLTEKAEDFTAAASQVDFVLAETPIEVIKVTVDGTEKTEGTDYTVDAEDKTITLSSAPGASKVVKVTYKYLAD